MLLYTLRRASPKTHPRSADPAGRGPPPAPSIIYILVGLLLEVFCLNHACNETRETRDTADANDGGRMQKNHFGTPAQIVSLVCFNVQGRRAGWRIVTSASLALATPASMP